MITGVDIPISLIRDNLVQNLWNNVSNQIYYTRSFRNVRQIDGSERVIPEVLDENRKYKEVLFDNKWNILVFFDVDNERSNILDKPETNLNIIFAVNLDAIHPGDDWRQEDNVHADVLQILRDTSNVSIDKTNANLKSGIDAYEDFYIENITAFNMQPFHTFKIELSIKYIYDCNDSQNNPVSSNPYPEPIIKN